MFAQDHKTWGAVNLKEWIDSYEGSRFTQVAYEYVPKFQKLQG